MVFLQLRHSHNTIKRIRRPPAVSNLTPVIQDDPTITTQQPIKHPSQPKHQSDAHVEYMNVENSMAHENLNSL